MKLIVNYYKANNIDSKLSNQMDNEAKINQEMGKLEAGM